MMTLQQAIKAFLEDAKPVEYRDHQGNWVSMTLGTTVGEMFNTQFRLAE